MRLHVAGLFFLAACSSSPSVVDLVTLPDGALHDASSQPDVQAEASTVDASDSSPPVDSGTQDSGVDAGHDAGTDAPISMVDAGDAGEDASPTGFACYGSYPNGMPIACYYDTGWMPDDGGACANLQPYGAYREEPNCPTQGLVGCCVCRVNGRTAANCYYSSPAPACSSPCAWQTSPP